MPDAVAELRERLGVISDLGRAGALLFWDERTKMPQGGGPARADQLATITRLGHELLISEELGELLERAGQELDGAADGDSDAAALVRVSAREAGKARRVPPDLSAEISRVTSLAEQAWAKAREASDFDAFRPHLERIIALKREYVECFAPSEHPYDPILDDFETGMTTAELEPVLTQLREGLRPLIEGIAGAPQLDDSLLHGHFRVAAQRSLAERVAAALPLPAGEWRLDDTVHPFATAIATTDVRITTRYDETFVGSMIWAVIHEAGHAMYENGVAPALSRTPLSHGLSLGFHESQSRLWENWVGRSRAFAPYLLGLIREDFPTEFETVDPEALYRAANRVEPSLIRVEADEVTYNLHVALRFELEVAIFTGELDPADLPEAWRERMRDYLGVEVPDDASGVLQDVHWAGGAFGYFPTYSLGNVIAGQLWELIQAAMPDLDSQLGRGELEPLREWLRENLHRHGAKFEPREMIKRLTGGPLDPGPLLRQLEAKYGELYGLV